MPKLIDMTGWNMWEHGVLESRLTVLYRYLKNDKENKPQWLCKCQCGKELIVQGKKLRNGNTKSCGCLQKEKAANNGRQNAKIHPGMKFGKLTVIEPISKDSTGKNIWKCICECGNTTNVICSNLGRSVCSCGCNKMSIGELNIINYLKENNYNFIHDKIYFKDLISNKGGYLRFDFIILNNNNQPYWLIEFDGRQHKENNNWFKQPLEERIANDNIKNKYAIEHHIPLVRIPYYQKNNITKEILFGKQYLIPEFKT